MRDLKTAVENIQQALKCFDAKDVEPPTNDKQAIKTFEKAAEYHGIPTFIRDGELIRPANPETFDYSVLGESIGGFRIGLDQMLVATDLANLNHQAFEAGSVVTDDFGTGRPYFGGRFPTKQLVDMIIDSVQLVREFTGFSVHLMGFGSSPLTLHLGFFCGVNSTDTTGYRRGAAYGKIITQGTGWRSVGKKKNSFDVASPSKLELEKLSKCGCPVCRKDQHFLYTNWKARAIHNKYVLQLEESRARRLIKKDFDAYEEYVTEVFSGRHAQWFVNLWEYARNRVKSMPLLAQSR